MVSLCYNRKTSYSPPEISGDKPRTENRIIDGYRFLHIPNVSMGGLFNYDYEVYIYVESQKFL